MWNRVAVRGRAILNVVKDLRDIVRFFAALRMTKDLRRLMQFPRKPVENDTPCRVAPSGNA